MSNVSVHPDQILRGSPFSGEKPKASPWPGTTGGLWHQMLREARWAEVWLVIFKTEKTEWERRKFEFLWSPEDPSSPKMLPKNTSL